ncbi:hypothetical protein GGF46_002476 [Coemansia sp. RSA 552]|nr:hypothetical protein GGF46_002476 [Coemansia sp. RSA 552]
MKAKAEINSNGPAVFEELLQKYEARIAALRQTREALTSTDPEHSGASDDDDDDDDGGGSDDGGKPPYSRALLTLELFQEMVDDMTMDVVFETHCEAKQLAAVCALCGTRCRCGGAALSPQPDNEAASDAFECPNCQRSYPAARFAAHMDKCMGLSGATSAASTPVQGYESSSEQSGGGRRRPTKRVRRG